MRWFYSRRAQARSLSAAVCRYFLSFISSSSVFVFVFRYAKCAPSPTTDPTSSFVYKEWKWAARLPLMLTEFYCLVWRVSGGDLYGCRSANASLRFYFWIISFITLLFKVCSSQVRRIVLIKIRRGVSYLRSFNNIKQQASKYTNVGGSLNRQNQSDLFFTFSVELRTAAVFSCARTC